MAVLTVLYVALGLLESPEHPNVVTSVLIGLAGIFFLEFVLRCLDDPSPRLYARDHWIDLVTCIPAVGPLRILRLLRLLRVFNGAGLIRRLAQDRGDASSSAGLRVFGAAIFAFWLLAACAFYLTERNQPSSSVHTFPDALLLAFTTSTTVGYSPLKAVTVEGQIVAGLVIFIALGLLTAASSQITALLTQGKVEDETVGVLFDVRDQLRRTEARLQAIEDAIRPPGEGINPAASATQLETG